MKKTFAFFVFFIALIFVAGCGGSSDSDESQSFNNCSQGDYQCRGGDSYICDYHDYNLKWVIFQECGSECDETTGKCTDGIKDTGDSGQADTGDPSDSTSDSGSQTNPGNSTVNEGIHLGVIGFNKIQYIQKIDLLDSLSADIYKNFINSLTTDKYTGLYFADYTALEKMRQYPVPPKLQKVALVTFTDGLDNISLSNDNYNPEKYASHAEYREALHKMIKEKIHGQKVDAYTIGLKGDDVEDDGEFNDTLEKLASEPKEEYVFYVSDMNEVNERFKKIAEDLYSVTKTAVLEVEVPGGYDDKQLLRFTFDIGKFDPATDSERYIEATYRRSNNGRTLEKVTYHGLATDDNTEEIQGISSENGISYIFRFENLKYENSDTLLSEYDIKKIILWKKTSNDIWNRESEFDPESTRTTTVDKSSALIMLVLDCTTSMSYDGFTKMKQAAKDFVTTLVNGAADGTSGNNSGGNNGGNNGGDSGTVVGSTCNEETCFKKWTCGEVPWPNSSPLPVVMEGHCNISTCECDEGWYTQTSTNENGETVIGETVDCEYLGTKWNEKNRNNVRCTVCKKGNPPSEYETTGCPATCPPLPESEQEPFKSSFCGNILYAPGSCYYELNGSHRLYCKCSDGYTMKGSIYYDENPTGVCESTNSGD